MVSSIPIDDSISPEGFLLLILLLVVIIIMVVIVVVILIAVVVIVGVVIVVAIIRFLEDWFTSQWSCDEDPTDEDGDTEVSVSLVGSSINYKCFTTAFSHNISWNHTKQNLTYFKDNTTTFDLSATNSNPAIQTLLTTSHKLRSYQTFIFHSSNLSSNTLNTPEDLLPTTVNPLPPRPSFDSIECLANEPSPILAIEPPLPPIPTMEPSLPPMLPQLLTFPPNHPSNFLPLLPLGPNNHFHLLTHEMFCEHCQRTQVVVNNLWDEMHFILNHILDRLNVLAHNY
nr:hypothetical protein [Tanacetum cinerariifolium]